MKTAHRILIVLAGVALVLAAMVAAFYGIEDWRGARAWEQCRHDLQAHGESLDVASFIPPMIPDDENLAMAPLFARMYGYRVDPVTGLLTFPSPPTRNNLKDEISAMSSGLVMPRMDAPRSAGDWTTGHPFDLAAWQKYYRARPDFPRAAQPQTPAEDVLLALTRYDPILDELARAAAARPRTRFPINWTEPQPAMIALPHYNALQCVTSILRLRATAHLALGHHDAVMNDLRLGQRLIAIPAADPVVIAQLVSVTETGIMMQPIWEGLKARYWSGPELEQIKTSLRGLDYLAGYKQTMRGERATSLCKTADYLKLHGGAGRLLQTMQSMQGSDKPDGTVRVFGMLIGLAPGGWYDQNKAVGCRWYQDYEIDTVDEKAHRVRLAKAKAITAAAQRMAMTPYTWMVKIGVPVFTSVLTKSVQYQADVDHAVIACALEQFYLDHHVYPERLDALAPGYLDRVPVDPIDGAQTRYRLTPDGRYLLYSVGWNDRDDGGQIAWQKEGVRRDTLEGDWVWQYQPLQPPASIQRSK